MDEFQQGQMILLVDNSKKNREREEIHRSIVHRLGSINEA